jgi:caffeoyl-CoA O-methyltransferase
VVFIASDEIQAYAEAHTTPPSELQHRLAEETRETLRSPQMLTGSVEGRLLEFLVFALRPQRVLELGTYSGYSSLSMAPELPPGGHIDTCEVDETHAAVARRYLDEAGVGDRVTIHLGPALETIERLEGEFDLIFIDADKVNYPAYYDALVPRLSPNGIMVLDNTLWSGRVAEPDDSPETQMFVELNARIASDSRVVAVMLTVRDGITLVRRRR